MKDGLFDTVGLCANVYRDSHAHRIYCYYMINDLVVLLYDD